MSTVDATLSTTVNSSNKSSMSKSFLQTTNPEVFQVRPRAGGALKTVVCEIAGEEFPGFPGGNISKDFRVAAAVEDCVSLNSQEATLSNPLKDNNYIVGIVLGTIIALASDPNKAPKRYLKWLRLYLNNVRDEFGNHPPNVQSLLNYLATLDLDAADESSEDKTIKTTTRVSLSQPPPEEGEGEAAEAEQPPAEEEAA